MRMLKIRVQPDFKCYSIEVVRALVLGTIALLCIVRVRYMFVESRASRFAAVWARTCLH